MLPLQHKIRRIWIWADLNLLNLNCSQLFFINFIFIVHYPATHPCQISNGGCDQLCFGIPGGHKCGCKNGYSYDKTQSKCLSLTKPITKPTKPPLRSEWKRKLSIVYVSKELYSTIHCIWFLRWRIQNPSNFKMNWWKCVIRACFHLLECKSNDRIRLMYQGEISSGWFIKSLKLSKCSNCSLHIFWKPPNIEAI